MKITFNYKPKSIAHTSIPGRRFVFSSVFSAVHRFLESLWRQLPEARSTIEVTFILYHD